MPEPSKKDSHLPLSEMPENTYVHFSGIPGQPPIGSIPTRFLRMALGAKICRDIREEWERLKEDARPSNTQET